MKVDVGHVLRSKNPAAARFVPGFVVRYLRRIVHEDEVNGYLEKYTGLPPQQFIVSVLADMGISYSAPGLNRLDPHGRYLFVSNHPFGGLDGLMLAERVMDRFGDARVVVNDLLMNLDPLKSIFVPVNKHGRQNQEYSGSYHEAFSSDIPIITFPAGLCSRREKGVVCDTPWKHSFVKAAVNYHRDIVPVFFDGTLSNFFYRLSSVRKKLGLKVNIEMLYLADEMFRQHGKDFVIKIGEPVPWQSLTGRRPSETARDIRQLVYDLKNNDR